MKRIIVSMLVSGLLFIGVAAQVSAHVVVSPNQAVIGTFQTFTIAVPTEKEIPTVGLRLVLPKGLQHVSPNVKPGWSIETKKNGETITEIVWAGGSIPTGQRDQFLFSAQVPAEETSLVWKAYQNYEDGTVVGWDAVSQDHEENEDHVESGPASETEIVNDLSPDGVTTTDKPTSSDNRFSMMLSYAALALSAVALAFNMRKTS